MAKLHTRQKRYLGITPSFGGFRQPRKKSKSFKTEAAAKKWAEANKIKNYEIVVPCMGLSRKFKVVVKK